MVDAQMPRVRLLRPHANDVSDSGALPNNDASVDDDLLLETLISHNGVMPRVAAELNVTEQHVVRVITRNADKLSTQLKAVMMVNSFTAVIKAGAVMQASLPDMLPGDVGRTFAASLGAFSQLAGQFQRVEEATETDDADAAKDFMLDRLKNIAERQQAQQTDAESAG